MNNGLLRYFNVPKLSDPKIVRYSSHCSNSEQKVHYPIHGLNSRQNAVNPPVSKAREVAKQIEVVVFRISGRTCLV